MPGEQFCLRWNNHQPNLISVFSSLLQNAHMADVTLMTVSGDDEIQAHKIVLSACSPYFQVTIKNKSDLAIFHEQKNLVHCLYHSIFFKFY